MITIRKVPFKDIEACGVSLHDKDSTWSLREHAEEQKWDIAVNGPMFSNGSPTADPYYYWNITDLIVGGIFNRGGNYSDKGIAFGNPWAGVSAYFTTTENSKGKPVDFIGGAPTLLIDGGINMDMKGISNSFTTAYTQRTAIGIDKANLYFATTKSYKHTLREVATAMKNAGCLWAINLDGGGSTAFYEKGKSYFTQGRNIPSAFGLTLKGQKPKIILDPGHSNLTKGKQSPDGTYKESEFTLDLANRMQRILQRYAVEPLIVDSSHEVASEELSDVIDKINAEGGDICVSLHSNALGDDFNQANGWEIFTYKMSGKSLQLAEKIHAESKVLGLTDRGIKDGSSYLIVRDTTMPCVLIETGFHTNREDLAKLKDSAFREKVATAYCKGILSYFGIAWAEPTNVTIPNKATIYRVQVGAFASKTSAEALATKLQLAGFGAYIKEDTV